jgi:hypothetical protein
MDFRRAEKAQWRENWQQKPDMFMWIPVLCTVLCRSFACAMAG